MDMGIVNAGALDIYDQVCTNLCLCLCLSLSLSLDLALPLAITHSYPWFGDLDPCRVAEID
jgi:hypothetical protein